MKESEIHVDDSQFVEVEYEYPNVGPMRSIGKIQESPEHIILVNE